MNFEFGDVVLVPFPFSDQSGVKKRPALIASSNDYNREHPDVIILAVTSRSSVFRAGRGEFVIQDTAAAGLLKASYGKPVLATIEQGLLQKTLGHLAEADVLSFRACLRYIIDGW